MSNELIQVQKQRQLKFKLFLFYSYDKHRSSELNQNLIIFIIRQKAFC